MEKNKNNDVKMQDIWNTLGRKIQITDTTGKFIIPDDLPQSDIDKIDALLYPNEETIKTDTTEARISRIERVLGLRK